MQVGVDQDERGLMRSASAYAASIGSTRSRTVSGGIGHTDTDHSTCLHVPSIDLVISGDAVYNGAHLYLAESNRQGRRDWLDALDKIEALNPRAVIAGHGVLEPDSDVQRRHCQVAGDVAIE
ncbi:MBL fold metallo-hydrolase [Paraburkholderia sediminicola]|uniref:MBL fold metallo-hydrolase n=1 Tax=Paraburkholderia metrosideri TaxID=580937 RepID=A0ABW9E5S8_9BURK